MNKRNKHWILDKDNRTPIPVDLLTWAKWIDKAKNRDVGDERIRGVRVSTVFLGLDHNFDEQGEPLIFETMIFGGDEDGYCERCSTWEQAVQMHARAVEIVTNANN